MTEEFLHYIWRCNLFHPVSAGSSEIEVLNTGEPNPDSGPDFFNAMIRIDGTLLAGNVEIHINSSDWYRHGHHANRAYDNVILQLVVNNDAEVRRTNGELLPTAQIRFDNRLLENYRELIDNHYWIPCAPFISIADRDVVESWLSLQALWRLEQRRHLIQEVLWYNKNDWQESFYQILARNFGFRLNGGAFEMLARSLPYRLVLRHRDSLFQVEAMLFGQAGLLCGDAGDDYFAELKREHHFLAKKYNLRPVEKHLWKFLRMRPANFPTIRIAQFASFLHRNTGMFAKIIETDGLDEILASLDVSASGYWDNHYVFGKPSSQRVKTLGRLSRNSIIINTIVPLVYFYGKYRGMPDLSDRAVRFLKEMPAESNSITRKWESVGISAGDAFTSQALIQQKNEVCDFKKCLDCRIGHNIIKQKRLSGIVLPP
jgi:hypothetical protein